MPAQSASSQSAGEAEVTRERAPREGHSLIEDLYANALGAGMIVFGMMMLKQTNLATGGVAGIALILSYLTGVTAPTALMIFNLPFFVYAWFRVGKVFAAKSIFASVVIMLLGLWFPVLVTVAHLSPLFAAIFGGSIIGLGVLFFARHGAGAGGVGILALAFNKTRGWNVGRTLMICDAFILLASLIVIGSEHFLLSLISTAAINAIVAVNHRPGRYITPLRKTKGNRASGSRR